MKGFALMDGWMDGWTMVIHQPVNTLSNDSSVAHKQWLKEYTLTIKKKVNADRWTSGTTFSCIVLGA